MPRNWVEWVNQADAAHRVHARYRASLRQEVASTLADPGAVDDEIRELFAAFAG